MRRLVILLWLFTSSISATVGLAQPSPVNVDSLVGLVRLDSLMSYVEYLTGIKPVYVADTVHLWQKDPVTKEKYTIPIVDTLVTLVNRRALSNDVATYYIERSLQEFGLDSVAVVTHSDSGKVHVRSVLGFEWGSLHPDRIHVICAHYDGVPPAPAADDNASGTAAVMEAARILAGLDPHSTILFALWDAEEGGLVGSRDWASLAADSGLTIASVVNLDMIAWDGDDDHVLEIHTNFQSSFLFNELVRLVDVYGFDLDPVLAYPGVGASDHKSFWEQGYPGILLIEEFFGGDFNPHYHSPSDSLTYFNQDFFHEVAKLVLASTASFAVDGAYEPTVHVSARALLQGPYAGLGRMEISTAFDEARPTAQPYGDPDFSGTPMEIADAAAVESLPDSAIDWLSVSLRSDTSAATEVVGSRRPAILMERGVIADTNGLMLAFPGIAPGPYHLVVRHRNHLSVISSDTLDLTDGAGSWDFTSHATGQKDLGDGYSGLFAADGNLDDRVTAGDFNLWLVETKTGSTGYRLADYDMDGQVTVTDFNLWLPNTKAGAASAVPE